MECDCKVDSACTPTSTYCRDLTQRYDTNADTGLWLDFNSVLTGLLTVVGYLLYKFSQALPAFVRWPVRLICSITGLSSLWSWVSGLVGTVRGIQTFFKWLSRLLKFTEALFSNLTWVPAVIKSTAGVLIDVLQWLVSVVRAQQNNRRPFKNRPLDKDQSLGDSADTSSLRKPGLRLILLGPSGGGRTSLANTLLGCDLAATGTSSVPVKESTSRRMVVDGREVTVVDTPDLVGPSLGVAERAREALRSLQLASPGPHAILLTIRAPFTSDGVDQDAAEAVKDALKLYGAEALDHVVFVLTHGDCLSQGCTLAQLLELDPGSLRTALHRCGQRGELVDNGPHCPLEARRETRRRLLEVVSGVRAARGHFVHELQRREERVREELLADMASVLAGKLGHM